MIKLKGKKTYIAAIAMIIYAITGIIADYHGYTTAVEIILEALAIIGLRNGIKSIQKL